MTRRAVLALLACTSCDNVLGLKSPVSADALQPRLSLTYAVLRSTPASTITYDAIAGVTVHYGSFDGMLEQATLDAAGAFAVPNALVTAPYRIVYDLPGDSTHHEVQWQAPAGAQLTVPRFGDPTRSPPPSGCGYQYTIETPDSTWVCKPSPPNPPCNLQVIAIGAAITGAWYQGGGGYHPSSTVANFTPTAAMTALDGEATPTSANGDLGIVLDFDQPSPPQIAIGYAFASLDMMAGSFSNASMVPMQGRYSGGTQAQTTYVIDDQSNASGASGRIATALGSLATTTSPADIVAGNLPDVSMPTMTRTALDGQLDDTVMIELAIQPTLTMVAGVGFEFFFANPLTSHDQPPGQVRPSAMRYRVFSRRTAGAAGPQLDSGFQEVTTQEAGGANTKATTRFDAAIATSVKFAGDFLSGDGSLLTLPATPFVDLDFTLEDPQSATTSDCVTTLYSVSGASLAPVRTIVVPTTSAAVNVRVPTSDFTHGSTYAFGIVCRNIYPGATAGDYTRIAGFPHSESQLFPGTFVIQ